MQWYMVILEGVGLDGMTKSVRRKYNCITLYFEKILNCICDCIVLLQTCRLLLVDCNVGYGWWVAGGGCKLNLMLGTA